MAFVRPTLSALVDRIQQDMVSRLALSAPILRRSVVYVLSRVMAGAAHMLHGHLEFLSRQVFPDQSEGEFLVRQAALFGLSKTPASYAAGEVLCTGTPGAIIPAGAILVRADGVEFKNKSEATVGTLDVDAVVPGAGGNTIVGAPVLFQSPIAGVDSEAAVDGEGIVGGADQETDAALRVRLIERMQSPPHGGNAADYIAWAKEVSGVTRAWVYPLEGGPGTVTVRFVRDNDASMIPDAGEVAAVQAYIDTLSPVTADVTVAAPVAAPIAFTIALTPSTTATKAAVTAELADLILRDAEPGGTVLLSRLRNAVGDAAGVANYVMTVPSADVTNVTGNISTLGVITWA